MQSEPSRCFLKQKIQWGKCFLFHINVNVFNFQLEKCSKTIFMQNEIFSVWVLPLLFTLFPFCAFGTGRRQNTIFLLSISFFCSAFFHLLCNILKILMEYFCSGALSRKKMSKNSKNKSSITVSDVRNWASLSNRMQCKLMVSAQWRNYQQNNGWQTRSLACVLFSGWFPDFTDWV